MNGPEILHLIRDDLQRAVTRRGEPPIFRPIDVSPWLAMSASQKAIRRGREDLALNGAASLLRDAPDRLWRRIGCIAYEDVGLASRRLAGSEHRVANTTIQTRSAHRRVRPDVVVAQHRRKIANDLACVGQFDVGPDHHPPVMLRACHVEVLADHDSGGMAMRADLFGEQRTVAGRKRRQRGGILGRRRRCEQESEQQTPHSIPVPNAWCAYSGHSRCRCT